MQARIYRPARSAMTSGTRNTRRWVLEYVPEQPKTIDPIMGWTGTSDMKRQVRLSFETREAAVEYAERKGLPYTVEEPKPRAPNIRPHGYGGNFSFDRRTSWTH